MKVREGFVSNSSSASFVIHTNWSIPELKKICHESVPQLFSLKYIQKRIKNKIADAEHMINWWKKEERKKNKVWIRTASEERKRFIEKQAVLAELLAKVSELSPEQLIDEILLFEECPISENALGKACFTGWTCMWNDEDDMGEFLVALKEKLIEKFGGKALMVVVERDY